jgi:hypothetical protein
MLQGMENFPSALDGSQRMADSPPIGGSVMQGRTSFVFVSLIMATPVATYRQFDRGHRRNCSASMHAAGQKSPFRFIQACAFLLLLGGCGGAMPPGASGLESGQRVPANYRLGCAQYHGEQNGSRQTRQRRDLFAGRMGGAVRPGWQAADRMRKADNRWPYNPADI